MEIEKLKKAICSSKKCDVGQLTRLSEKLREENTNASVISDLPKLLPGIFKYAFHEDAKFREAAIPGYIELVNLLDLNKHLKEKSWWKEMKEVIVNSVDLLMQLVSTGDGNWAVLWSTTVLLVGTDLRCELALLNKLLKVVEKGFKLNNEEMRKKCFECWCKLIDNFSIDRKELNNKRRLNLLVIPLKANNHNTPKLCALKMQTWKYLLSKLDQHNELTVQLVITHFLEFMFGGLGGVAPACKSMSTECADVFQKLLTNSELFRILPDLFIKYIFTCIEYICGNVEMSISVWTCLLGNIKHVQWEEKLVTMVMNSLNNVDKSSEFAKSKAYAEMISSLYTGKNCMPDKLLVKHCKMICSLVLEPNVLLHYTETKCDDLLKIISKSNPVLLPENMLSDLISKLYNLSASESFRDNKLKLLRGIWIQLTSTMCTWMSENGQLGKDGTVQTEMNNMHQLLLFGAADLSTMWNKYQMKIWKTLYSESTKYFSLLPEAACDTFPSNLVTLLQDEVHKKRIPLHVAVDLVTIILEIDMSKDASHILPLMMAIGECAVTSLLQDISGISFLNQFIKTLVIAAKKEPAFSNDILQVIEKMLKYMEEYPFGSHHDEIRNMILKAQHQVQVLKPSRTQKKSVSPVVAQPASSPTMTSFLHRLAKAKETQAKMNSPNSSQITNISTSPVQAHNSKKIVSPFADLKSENFVFVPPKSRKTVLTDHQRESLTKRKHDIPALYQDLSQDSSQSALESIVTSVQPTDDVKKGLGSSSLKEVDQATDMITKTVNKKIINSNKIAETAQNKCKENLSSDENDQVNNNTHSPFSSLSKRDESDSITPITQSINDDNSKTVLESTPKSMASLEKYKTNILNKNTPVRENISELLNHKEKETNCINQENCIETKKLQDSGLIDDKSNIHGKKLIIDKSKEPGRTSSCISSQEKNIKTSGGDRSQEENKTLLFSFDKKEDTSGSKCQKKINESPVDTILNKSYSGMIHEQVTPKRSTRINKLIVTREKKTKTPKGKIKETGDKPKPSSTSKESPISTPKISPRRLRIRKSGGTPILSGGKVSRKSRKSSLNTSNLDNESNKSTMQETSESSSKVCQSDDKVTIENLNVPATNCDTEKCSANTTDINTESFKSVPSNDIEIINKTVSKHSAGPTLDSVAISTNVGSLAKITLNETKVTSVSIDIKSIDSSKEFKQEITSVDNSKECKQDIIIIDSSKESKQVITSIDSSKESKQEITITDNSKEPKQVIKSIDSSKESKKEMTTSLNNMVKEDDLCITNSPDKMFSLGKNVSSNNSLGHVAEINNKDIIAIENAEEENAVKKNTLTVNQSIESGLKKSFDDTENEVIKTDTTESESKGKKSFFPKEMSHDQQETDAAKCNSIEHLNASKDTTDRNSLETEKPVGCISKNAHDNHKKETVDSLCSSETKSISNKIECEFQEKECIILSDLSKTKPCGGKKAVDSKGRDGNIVEKQVVSDKDTAHTTNDSTDSYLITRTQAQENDTPSKSVQKTFKQTQLPFTPIKKTQDSDKNKVNNHSKETNLKYDISQINEKSVLVQVEKLSPYKVETICNPKRVKNESHMIIEGVDLSPVKDDASLKIEKTNAIQNNEIAINHNLSQQEIRTPEKSKQLNDVSEDLSEQPVKKCDAESPLIRESPPLITVEESPNKETESQDFIASSQENELTTLSFIKSDKSNDSVSCSPSKKVRKCPKKYEGVSYSQISNSSVRTPLRVDTPRKSVCRRLDIEVDEDLPEISFSSDVKQNRIIEPAPISGESKSSDRGQSIFNGAECSEELLMSDIKLLKEDNVVPLTSTIDCGLEPDNLEPNSEHGEVDLSSANCENEPPTPENQYSLKRFMPHSNSTRVESPKRPKVSLNAENTSSPMSPSSRTNHMMELAMKDKEQIMSSSSPVSSLKKRRIHPVRVGSLLRTPKNQSNKVTRVFNGPSEEWVCRNYSHSASPNSSILKRRSGLPTMISPDSSPPSVKKKRVSFLDPPVSESLLFDELNPGHGQVQRPESKQECESEEMPSQGSVQLVVSPQSSNQTSVFSPLKECANPLTDVLERIVSLQWISELNDQLGRLGVTTIGQLSSLSETTVERLPFIPPRVERLRKILQNYFNEISEKLDIAKSENSEEKATDTEENVDDSNVELVKPSSSTTGEKESCISLIADEIQDNIEKYPELIKELGDRLDVDVILSILNCAVSKLKNKSDSR